MAEAKVIWDRDVTPPTYPKLERDIEVDVAIIGAGITGLLVAYQLIEAGKKVAMLEKDQWGWGATGATTAFITQVLDTDLQDLIPTYGNANAKLIIESHGRAIDLIESIIKKENIDCEFKRTSNYYYANTESDFSDLEAENEAAQQLGLETAISPDGSALSFNNKGYLEIKNQAKFQPRKFLARLSEIIVERGGLLFEHTEALEITQEPRSVKTANGIVNATDIVSATYEPFHQPLRLFFKKGMYESFVTTLKMAKGVIPEAMYEDSNNPYHYFRVDRYDNHDQVTIGGEDHRQDLPVSDDKSFESLLEYARTIFTQSDYEVITQWKGQILEPIDGLAYIGKWGHEHTYYAFAFSGTGMTYAAISAMIIPDLILGRTNPYTELYRVDRLPGIKALIIKGRDYFGELLGGVVKNTFAPTKHDNNK